MVYWRHHGPDALLGALVCKLLEAAFPLSATATSQWWFKLFFCSWVALLNHFKEKESKERLTGALCKLGLNTATKKEVVLPFRVDWC